MQALPGMQSLSVWQGHAHLPAVTLQRWVRQWASIVHGRASGFGVDSAAPAVAAGKTAGEVASTGLGVVPSPYPGACVTGAPAGCV